MESVNELFVKKTEGDKTRFSINSELALRFNNEQEAAQFLVEVIRFWHKKCRLFCGDSTWKFVGDGNERTRVDLPEDEWGFDYKTPSDCGGCVRGQEILDKIFGSRQKFNALPFVIFHGDRQYSFRFELLKYFAENGLDSIVRLIEDRKKEEARKQSEVKAERQRKLRQEQDVKLAERLGGKVVSDELRRQILPYVDNESLVFVSHDVAAVRDERHEYGSSGGVGMYDQVRVFCGSQSETQEWQWRDRYSASNDRRDLAVHSIGAVKVSKKDNRMVVEVELVNRNYGNRTATYTFDPPKAAATRMLSAEEQAAFAARVEKEVSRIMADLNRLWECKPQMPNRHSSSMSDGYVPYRQPSIKQREFRPEIGVAAFVTEEQIDHKASDSQIRYELYVLTVKGETAVCKAEDHGYDRREGGAFLTILEVASEHVSINSKSGKQTIKL
jgi:hypothetical protein